MRKIITISREFGSGGRELGKRLADVLHFAYLDAEITETLSRQTHVSKEYLDKKLESGIDKYPVTFASSFARISQTSNSAMLLAKQHKIIKELAGKQDCIIVGRGADAILNEYRPFRIFVYADTQSKINRCKRRQTTDEAHSDNDILRKMKNIDKARKSVHDLYSPYSWGDKSGYHLCLNTSDIVIKEIVPIVAAYIQKYFEGLEL